MIGTGARAAAAAALLSLFMLPSTALAVPSNNDPGGLQPLNVPDFRPGTNVDADTYSGEPLTLTDARNFGCRGDGTEGAGGVKMGKTVWYGFVGTGERLTISTALSDIDTVLAVHTLIPGPFFQFEGCNDDIDGPAGRLGSELVLQTVPGEGYYVQVGGCCGGDLDNQSFEGAINISVFPPPPNDSRSSAQSLGLDESRDNFTFGALSEPGETLTCNSEPYDKTVWYRFETPGDGDITATAGGFNTVASVYRADGERVGCAFNPGGGTATLPLRLGRGTYFLQVGGRGSGVAARDGQLNVRVAFRADTDGDDDGFSPPQDCNDSNPGIHPGAPSVVGNGVDEDCDGSDPADLDEDNDGSNRPDDCNDKNAQVRPGAREIKGNGVDDNCDGDNPDFDQLLVRYEWDARWARSTRFSELIFRRIPAGTTVRIVCRGRGCKRKRYVRRFPRGARMADFARAMRPNRPRPRGVLEIQLTKPDQIGQVVRFIVRLNRKPRVARLCLRPGARRATSCG